MSEPESTNPNPRPHKRPFSKPEWELDKVFEAGGLAVEVSKDASRKPTKYSMRMGIRRADGSLNGNIPVRKEDNIASGSLAQDYSGILSDLISQAVMYMHEKIGWEWHQWVEQRVEYDERKSGAGRQQVRKTGKTARERAKKAGKQA